MLLGQCSALLLYSVLYGCTMLDAHLTDLPNVPLHVYFLLDAGGPCLHLSNCNIILLTAFWSHR